MGTGNTASIMEEETGIVHRAIQDIFQIVKVYLLPNPFSNTVIDTYQN